MAVLKRGVGSSVPEGVRGQTCAQRRRATGLGVRVLGVVALAALTVSVGCGSVTLPDRSSLPSISLPARPTALPSLSRPTATATATETATATATATETATATATATETATATATVTVSASSAPAETTVEATPSPETSPEPAPAEDADGGLWWVLALLAVVAGLVVAGVMWSRSRSASKEIERRFDLVRSELAWADEDLLPRVLASPSAAEAAALWEAGRPRLLVVEEELRQLAVSSSGEEPRDRATQWRTALATLVTAVDAETGLPSSASSERLRSTRAQVEEARRSMLALLEPPPS